MITCIKSADRPNKNVSEFSAETNDEVDLLPTTKRAGKGKYSEFNIAEQTSICIVGNKEGALQTWMLFGFGWKNLQTNEVRGAD